MPRLLVIGSGLFGSLAAALARLHGIEALVFDDRRQGRASPASAGLFCHRWCGAKGQEHYQHAVPVLELLYGIRSVSFARSEGPSETLLCVPPAVILEPSPVEATVTALGDGWLEANGQRYHGWVYVATGVWSPELVPEVPVSGKEGMALLFPGEGPARMEAISRGRQALAFVRDPGQTYFSDGTAESPHMPEHAAATRARAHDLGLHDPLTCWLGRRPYSPGGPLFRRLGAHTWVATGGRKLGTVLAASLARRLVEVELRG